jgi:hypothetical protein
MSFIGYFDDGGHPDNEEVVLVAGWIGTEEQWSLFEKEWKKALADAGIPEERGFHATDFESPRCKDYSGWTKHQKDCFRDRLINLACTRTRMSFATLIPMYDYKMVNEEVALEECIGKPYAVAGRIIGKQLNEWRAEYNKTNVSIVTVFENGTKHKGDLMDLLARDGFDPPVFREKQAAVPLQAADLLAWEYFNGFKTGRIRPSLNRIFEHPNQRGIYTAENMLRTCEIAKAPPRHMVGEGSEIVFANLQKKLRTRSICGLAPESSVKGKNRIFALPHFEFGAESDLAP